MPLNYYAISKIIGGKMVPAVRPRFGNFGLLGAVAGVLGSRPEKPARIDFSIDKDRLVCEAFEQVRDGAAPDRILWDPHLANRFHRRCRELGIEAPSAILGRRLLNIRKNSPRYAKHGIKLSPTTSTEPHPSVVPKYAHAIEFALVRLRYRYGASIDDILLDSTLVSASEQLASRIAVGLSPTDLRLGALYIRKTRHMAKRQASLFDKLDPDRIESELQDLGVLPGISHRRVPACEGLLEVFERDRYLYIARNDDLRAVVDQFVNGPTLSIMQNHFWVPRPEDITIRIFAGAQFMSTPIYQWQLKLIRVRGPVFNWPVVGRAA